jgi:hypothetical protein
MQPGAIVPWQQQQQQQNASAQTGKKGVPKTKINTYDPRRHKAREEKQVLQDMRPISPEAQVKGLKRLEKPLHHRIGTSWRKDEVLYGLDHRIQQYVGRHGGFARDARKLVAPRGGPKTADGNERQQELAILDKMRQDEEAGALKLPVERSIDEALRVGYRDFIDYAVDEVERFGKITKTGAVTAEFDWSSCGDFHDVPALRRSSGLNRVDGPPGHVASLGNGSDDMFEMDFLRDFTSRKRRPLSEEEGMMIMKMAARDAKEPPLRRADNDMLLCPDDRDYWSPEDDMSRLPDMSAAKGPFRPGEWAVEYSMV